MPDIGCRNPLKNETVVESNTSLSIQNGITQALKPTFMSEFGQVVTEGAEEIKKKAIRGAKRITAGLLLLGAIGLAGYLWVISWTFSEGTRAGTLIKISRKGVIFKTYEGQLNLGGFRTDGQAGLSGNIWEFSVLRRDVYQKLQQYEGKQVKLHYRERYKAMPWQGDTNYFVYEVEEVR